MTDTSKPFLGWRDFAELFGCGRSKAMLLMHEVGVVHIGNAVFVRAKDLDDYLDEHGAIDITWPRRKPARKGETYGRKH